ncbi:ATP-binding protein [Streptomyces albireticuli]|uniref:ATP-binding protein n=1 Tax=Streptomyces albireticuli TaxID=1940 RepID=UPI0036AB2791
MRTAMLGNHARTYRLTAPAAADTVRVAREFVRAILTATEHSDLIDAARVCVSDAVTAVLPRARDGVVTVEVYVRPGRVIVKAGEASGARRRHRETRTRSEPERGLVLIRKLSHASGVEWARGGRSCKGAGKGFKEVWFELRGPREVAQ